MSVAAIATADARVLTFCPVRACLVARTCRQLAGAARSEWPRVAASLGRVAEAGALAVERRDDEGLAELARLAPLPVEVLRRAIALGRFDAVAWFFTVSDAVDDEARAALIAAGRAHLLPRHLWPPDVADLTADALVLTEAVIDAWVALEPEALGRHRQAFHHNFCGTWATLLMMPRTGSAGRPSAERQTVESPGRRLRVKRFYDVVGDVESASPGEYAVEMQTSDGVALTVAPLLLIQTTHVEFVFTPLGSTEGPFVVHFTSYVLPDPQAWCGRMWRGDGYVVRNGRADSCDFFRS
jgi:hypothetical protein